MKIKKNLHIFVILLLILIFSLFFVLISKKKNIKKQENKKNKKNKPCSNNLTDREYLEHMIPHHQVAVDISVELQKKTKNPIMQKILRELIWTQEYEIQLMKDLLYNLPKKVSINNEINTKLNTSYSITNSDFISPNSVLAQNTYCDPHFFNPEEHKKHMSHMKLNDKIYIKHMIPHHQVAVDMSKKLLKNTKNDFMIQFAYRIIRSQQQEIILLNDLMKKGNINYQSPILP